MPRRKAKPPQDAPDLPILMLPPARKHAHGHGVDPYVTLPGAMPTPSRITRQEPLKRKDTRADIQARHEANVGAAAIAERYMHYLDSLANHFGNQEAALADAFGLELEDVRPRRLELLAEVRRGLAASTLADVLERNNLDLTARVNILRKHAYSTNPAASLKAIDMAGELEGTRADAGNFESYLRTIKRQKGER